MKIKFLINIFLLCVLLCTSCVEKYTPNLEKYENILVIDGMINNKPGPYTIKLSVSSPIGSLEYIPKTNAEVIIFDDDRTSETLTENNPGEYSTAVDGIQGVAGRKYKIQITTSENKIYSSDFEELPATVGIDTVYANVESLESIYYSYDLNGLQFYLDTKLAVKDTNYFLWRLESTYEYNSSYKISHIFNGTLEPCINRDTLFTCWKTTTIGKIYTSNTVGLSEPLIKHYPLNYISTEGRALSIRYSLLVDQMTISQKAYNFWHNIEDLNSEQGTLFSSLPYQIRGNVFCESDAEEPVLGYFIVAGLAKKRIFIDRPSLTFHYQICTLSEKDFMAMSYLYWAPPNTWPLYITSTEYGAKAYPHQNCIDCTLKGGSLNKPDFWID